jgi:protein-S-isoprenylcysteine O-methyltransferase Ste14
VYPEARRLVTSGPYAFVRHPVYLFEEITFFGVMLQYAQPWALCIFAIQLCFQLARIPYEERVLTDAFPEYADYAARTSRLIPGVY